MVTSSLYELSTDQLRNRVGARGRLTPVPSPFLQQACGWTDSRRRRKRFFLHLRYLLHVPIHTFTINTINLSVYPQISQKNKGNIVTVKLPYTCISRGPHPVVGGGGRTNTSLCKKKEYGQIFENVKIKTFSGSCMPYSSCQN